jgi:hypothetical protein
MQWNAISFNGEQHLESAPAAGRDVRRPVLLYSGG